MNKTLFILLILISNFGVAQNLVPNPSFEDTVSCPTADNQINLSLGWEAFGSPEYFNRCSTSPDVSIPNNWGGYQQPATGDAYAAVSTYGDLSFGFSCDVNFCNSREYIGQFLSTPLSTGTKYYISFKASLSLSSSISVNCASDKLGILFSTIKPTVPMPMITNQTLVKNFAHVFTPIIITDSLDWTSIKGSFTADSNYQYILIGNFFDDINTTTQIMDGNTYCNSYYFIDDICVSTDSLTCVNPVGISGQIIDNDSFNIYPNPATDFFSINNISNQSYNLTIYNSIGQLLFEEENINKNSKKIKINNFNSNLLFIKIKSNNQSIIYKLLIL